MVSYHILLWWYFYTIVNIHQNLEINMHFELMIPMYVSYISKINVWNSNLQEAHEISTDILQEFLLQAIQRGI